MLTAPSGDLPSPAFRVAKASLTISDPASLLSSIEFNISPIGFIVISLAKPRIASPYFLVLFLVSIVVLTLWVIS